MRNELNFETLLSLGFGISSRYYINNEQISIKFGILSFILNLVE
jgi:hypothetical protein